MRPSRVRYQLLHIAVPDLAAAVAFYEPTLASIGITKMLQIPPNATPNQPTAMTGFGLADVKPYFWLIDGGSVGTNMHLAFTVDTRDDVHTFYEAALAAGASPLHAPAVHTQYHGDYYGAFVTDPHGINLEAVCHRPPAPDRGRWRPPTPRVDTGYARPVMVTGLVLAAGAGRRYGMAKALVAYRGEVLVRRAADTLRAAGCERTVVVLGAEAERVRAAAPGLDTVDNPDWASGMASSLRAGLAALDPATVDAAVVLLVDMPGVTPEAVRRVAALAAPDALAVGGYGDRRGHPVLLGRAHWAGVAASATGDRGARDYLRSRSGEVRVVPVGDVADDTDIDVPTDAEKVADARA